MPTIHNNGATIHVPEPSQEEFIRKATRAERIGSKPKQRAMGQLSEQHGRAVVFKPYGSQGSGFYSIST